MKNVTNYLPDQEATNYEYVPTALTKDETQVMN